MKQLWSPWRSKYVSSIDEVNEKDDRTFIAKAIEEEDDNKNLVVTRRDHCIVIMNKYPYNNGHILICPLREISDIDQLTPEEYNDINQTLLDCIAAIKKVYNPHGYNTGVNVGEAAGAGVPKHLHYHIVPRWKGDLNFMPALSDTKVISQSIEESLYLLRKELK